MTLSVWLNASNAPHHGAGETEMGELIREVMAAYDKARAEQVAVLGGQFNEAAFHAWFTAQVQGGAA